MVYATGIELCELILRGRGQRLAKLQKSTCKKYNDKHGQRDGGRMEGVNCFIVIWNKYKYITLKLYIYSLLRTSCHTSRVVMEYLGYII